MLLILIIFQYTFSFNTDFKNLPVYHCVESIEDSQNIYRFALHDSIEFPNKLFKHNELIEIDLSDSKVKDFRFLKNFPKLRSLILTSNTDLYNNLKLPILDKIPTEVYNLFYLEILIIDNHNISEIDSELTKLSNLTFLSLRYNNIKTFNITLSKFKYLKYFDISNNKICNFSDSLKAGSDLKLLLLKNNLVSTLPVINGNKLELIDFSGNQIEAISSEKFFNFKYLYTLNLSGNILKEFILDDYFVNNVENLIISNNFIEELSVRTSNKNNKNYALKKIFADNNRISNFDSNILTIYSLDVLSMEKNNINEIFISKNSNNYLTKLFLKGNNLKYCSLIINELKYLKYIDISNNKIIENSLFIENSSVEYIDISNSIKNKKFRIKAREPQNNIKIIVDEKVSKFIHTNSKNIEIIYN